MKLGRLHVRGHDLGVTVSITQTPHERMRGLLGRDHLLRNEALLLEHCRSIHTFRMRFAIDVLFLDRHQRVLKIYHNVPNRRMLLNFRASQTLEMPAGACRQFGLQAGDILAFEAIR